MNSRWTKQLLTALFSLITLISWADEKNYNNLYVGSWSFTDQSLPYGYNDAEIKSYEKDGKLHADFIFDSHTIKSSTFIAEKSGAQITLFVEGVEIVLHVNKDKENLDIYFNFDCNDYNIVCKPKTKKNK